MVIRNDLNCQTLGSNVIIYTVLAGGYDTLPNHPDVDGCEFIAILDETTPMTSNSNWEIRRIKRQGLNSKDFNRYYKINPYLIFKGATLYIDANIEIHSSVSDLLQAFKDDQIAIFSHASRKTVEEELEVCRSLGLINPIEYLRTKKIVKIFQQHNVLTENNIIYRADNYDIKSLMERWWEFYSTVAKRDQLGLTLLKGSESIQVVHHDLRRKYFTVHHHVPSKIKKLKLLKNRALNVFTRM